MDWVHLTQDGIWIGSIWRRMEFSGGLLSTR